MSIRSIFRIIKSLPYSIWFNFRHLPFNDALHLPILIYKPRILDSRGTFRINGKISTGMIRLGWPSVSIYPNSGIMIENKGEIIFSGKCMIGNDSALSVGETGTLTFGNNVVCTCTLKVACYHNISIGEDTLIGWNCLFTDTDFHKLSYPSFDSKRPNKGFGSIHVGARCWIANGCKFFKNVNIPDEVIIGSDTILKKSPDCEGPCAISTSHSIIIRKGIKWDPNNDNINYLS